MKKVLFIALSLTLLLSACTAASEPSASRGNNGEETNEGVRAVMRQQPIQPVNTEFVSGVNSFGFKSAGILYNTDENLALSPVSLELALAMTRTGAAGATADEMKTALGLEGVTDEEIISACRSLMWRCNTGGMEAVNSIWLLEGYPFSEEFLRGCTEDFMADAFPLVISKAKDDINAWANEKTHGRINDIIREDLHRDTALVLCNALFYLGDWEEPFEAGDTHDEEFTATGGSVTVPFMHSIREADYYEGGSFSMLSLPFKSEEGEGKYSMAFLLPNEGSSIKDMLSSLDGQSFFEALQGLEEQTVSIKLPKFEYSFYSSFVDTLKSLGMNEAFSSRSADFSNMTGGFKDLYIDEVLHKCYIRVDELGAEAAAVTAVIMVRGADIPPKGTAEFFADRPFVFCIYSQEDGAIAFMGAVNDPSND